nr:unnamed protein product [Callosobruchus analis]
MDPEMCMICGRSNTKLFNVFTIYGTINRTKGGIKPKALVDDEINTIVEWIEDDCGLTLKQVKIKVLVNFHGRLFTMKQVHKQSISMNSEENKRKRAEYVTALNRYIELGKQIKKKKDGGGAIAQ